MNVHRRLAALVAAMLPLLGDTLVVAPENGDFDSVQAALDAASPGDEVLVSCGVYFENVTLADGVHLRGVDPACAVIDGGGAGDVVTIPPTSLPTTVERLTIRNGNQNIGSLGAGVRVIGPGSPLVTRNVIEDNGLAGSGSGVVVSGTYTLDDGPVISRNVIRGNQNCCWGGGVSISGSPDATVVGNLVAGNSAYYGGGIYAYGGGSIEANTIVDNDAWIGGGVMSVDTSLVNNLITGNSAVIYAGGVFAGGVAVDARNNDVVDNEPEGWFTIVGDLTGTDGNISEPPLLLDRQGRTFRSVQPRSTSPLVDAGLPLPGVDHDLRGVPRSLDGDADGVGLPDIGARENEGVTGVRLEEGGVLRWDDDGASFDLYRGDLATLRATGVYTQDPAVTAGAMVWCSTAQSGLVDTDIPPAGAVYYYLVAVRGLTIEGPLGFSSAGSPRPSTLPDCLI